MATLKYVLVIIADSRTVMLVADSMGSMRVGLVSLSGTAKHSGGVLSAVMMIGTVATGIVAVSMTACPNASCLELDNLEDAREDSLDLSLILVNNFSRDAAFSACMVWLLLLISFLRLLISFLKSFILLLMASNMAFIMSTVIMTVESLGYIINLLLSLLFMFTFITYFFKYVLSIYY